MVLSYRPVTATCIQTFLSYMLDRGVPSPLKEQALLAGMRLLLLTFLVRFCRNVVSYVLKCNFPVSCLHLTDMKGFLPILIIQRRRTRGS